MKDWKKERKKRKNGLITEKCCCCCVTTTVWMNHVDNKKMHREKASREQHKTAASYFAQILEATASTKQQLYGYLPPISKTIQVRQTWPAEHCWRRKVFYRPQHVDVPVLTDS